MAPQLKNDARLKYIPNFLSAAWPRMIYEPQDPKVLKSAQALHVLKKKIVALFAREGVPLLVGTDVANPYVFPGFSVHDEMQIFVEAGLTPLLALQAATLNAARFLKAENTAGSIASL